MTRLLWLLAFLFFISGAHAQTCATRPPGDSTNACASTAFVHGAVAPISGLTPNLPLIGSPSGGIAQGTRQGNTTKFAATTGIFTAGNCRTTDGSGNEIDAGFPCNSGTGSGTVSSATIGQIGVYPATGTVIAGVTNLTLPGTITGNTAGPVASFGGSTPVAADPTTFFYPTYFSNAGNGVGLKANRIQVGLEALSSLDAPQTTQSWANTIVPNSMEFASAAITNQLGQLGLTAAARTSDYRAWQGSASQGSEGIVGIGYNDDTGSGNPIACGICAEAIRASGVTGLTINQFDAMNFGSLADTAPYTGVNAGSTIAMLLTPGVFSGGNNASAAMAVGPGTGSKVFENGIVFYSNSLNTGQGAGGGGIAIALASGQSFRWVNSSNTPLAEIWADTASAAFHINGNLVLTGIASGTANRYVCLTIANEVIAQAGPC